MLYSLYFVGVELELHLKKIKNIGKEFQILSR
jgi:hypothetical protein